MATVKVLHVSLTPLAGAPIRLVNALNKNDNFEARLVVFNNDFYGKRTFQTDLQWPGDKADVTALIKNADIIHLHHYFDFKSDNNPFELNFKQVAKNDVIFVRHYHSHPKLIADDDFAYNETPSFVIPHYPSRYYPDSTIVPNIIPHNDDLYLPISKNNKKPLVVYSPSSLNSAFTDHPTRWDTKSYPEVLKIVKQAQKIIDFDFKVITNTPHAECLQIKQQADIIIDDIATGSMHLSALEGLSQGAVVISYLDDTVYNNFINLTSSSELPVVNVRLKEMTSALVKLVENKDLREDLSKYSRYWVENHYSEEKMIEHYINAYNQLLKTNLLTVDNSHQLAKNFIRTTVPELRWQYTKKTYPIANFKYNVLVNLRKIKRCLKQCLNKK